MVSFQHALPATHLTRASAPLLRASLWALALSSLLSLSSGCHRCGPEEDPASGSHKRKTNARKAPQKKLHRCPLLRHVPSSAAVAFVLPDLGSMGQYERAVRELLSLCPKGLSTRHLGRDLGIPIQEIHRHAQGWIEALPKDKKSSGQGPGFVAYALGTPPNLTWFLKLVGSCPEKSKGSHQGVNPTQILALPNGKCAAYGALGFVCRTGPQGDADPQKGEGKAPSFSPPLRRASLLESTAVKRSDQMLKKGKLGIYLDLKSLLWSPGTSMADATRELLGGALPASLWIHTTPRSPSPNQAPPGIRELDVDIWWGAPSSRRLLSISTAPAHGTKKGAGDLALGRLTSSVSIELRPQDLMSWLIRLSGPLKGLLKRIRREQGAPTKLLTRNLTGRLILGTHRAGPVVLAETPSPNHAAKVLRQIALLASALQEVSPERSLKAVSGWGFRHVRSRWGEKILSTLEISPKPVRPGLPPPDKHWQQFHVTWARLGRYIALTTQKGGIRGLMKRLSLSSPALSTAPPKNSASLAQAQESRGDPSKREAPVSGTLRLDDPYSSLPDELREDLDFFLHRLPGWLQKGLPALRALLDRVFEIRMKGAAVPSGVHLHATFRLLQLNAPVREGQKGSEFQSHRALLVEALRHRRKNNLQGYFSRLERLAVAPGTSPYKKKASRILKARTSPDGTFGWLARLLSAYLWRRIQLESCRLAEQTTRTMETALFEHLESKASDGNLPTHKKGWGLGDTGLTPGKRCCLYPIRLCPNDEEKWRHPTWRKVGAVPSSPGPYQYEITFSSSSRELLVTLTAVGAPFCDGKRQIYRRIRRVDPRGRPTSPPTTSWKAPTPPKPDPER